MSGNYLSVACACAALLPAAAARGAFVNGVETFQGAGIDKQTWVVEWPHTLRTVPDGLNILMPEWAAKYRPGPLPSGWVKAPRRSCG